MIRLLTIGILWLVFATLAHAAETEQAKALDPGHDPVTLRIWLPAKTGGTQPLIVLSHGTIGMPENHADLATALSEAGFIVAGVTHTGDTVWDQSAIRGGTSLVDRPRHIARVIDYMLTAWQGHARIDAARIGVFGFSSGGFTALVVAGGVPDLSRRALHCKTDPEAWDCRYLRKHGRAPETDPVPAASDWVHDQRVKAIVVAAPAVGYSFAPEGLSAVKVPVQLWVGEKDAVVTAHENTDVVRAQLAAAEYRLAKGAAHFSFLDPCDWRAKSIITVMHWFGTEDICADPDGFDRTAFHAGFNREVVRFFSETLAPPSR